MATPTTALPWLSPWITLVSPGSTATRTVVPAANWGASPSQTVN